MENIWFLSGACAILLFVTFWLISDSRHFSFSIRLPNIDDHWTSRMIWSPAIGFSSSFLSTPPGFQTQNSPNMFYFLFLMHMIHVDFQPYHSRCAASNVSARSPPSGADVPFPHVRPLAARHGTDDAFLRPHCPPGALEVPPPHGGVHPPRLSRFVVRLLLYDLCVRF